LIGQRCTGIAGFHHAEEACRNAAAGLARPGQAQFSLARLPGPKPPPPALDPSPHRRPWTPAPPPALDLSRHRRPAAMLNPRAALPDPGSGDGARLLRLRALLHGLAGPHPLLLGADPIGPVLRPQERCQRLVQVAGLGVRAAEVVIQRN
jgi:hypothetical protein